MKPTEGNLLVDGLKIEEKNAVNWRKNIGYVPQDIYLIDDTIESNIAFGVNKNEIDKGIIESVSKIANIHDFIKNDLENGYQTVVGERGVRLSGGQKQRIGIARALYFSPSLLVLDEATSALDNVTENLVMESIEKLNKQITIITIAHRLSTIQKCNQILIFDRGRLVEYGSYYELMESSKIFKQMHNLNEQN